MIPAPKLDDRTYAEIVAEAIRLIPRYAPEWTNHNASDLGNHHHRAGRLDDGDDSLSAQSRPR